MQDLLDDIRQNNGIREPIKVVEHNGNKYIVDDHHRYFAARKLGINKIPIETVNLPFKSHGSIDDIVFTESIRIPSYWRWLKISDD